jgi:deoxyadenosine/deoxycytidine kinase
MAKMNIAVAGGPCTGKSVVAAHLFAHLKCEGFDYDLILEECRKLKKEFGKFNDPFERFYMWRQQEREELRSTAGNGFITDKPLFHYYAQVKQFASKPRDRLAFRELWRMCMELEENNRYQLIIMAENPDEFGYRMDQSRSSKKEIARERHQIIQSYVEHVCPGKLLRVHGDLEQRTRQALKKIQELHSAMR